MALREDPVARPVLFAAPMVRAILAGQKTQTRRVITPQPDLVGRDHDGNPVAFRDGRRVKCRFGLAGDRLWVRERWGYFRQFTRPNSRDGGRIVYGADAGSEDLRARGWRSSRNMPRIASRIVLEITHVRIQRLRQTSRDDARAEGFLPVGNCADPLLWFSELWDSLNADHGFGWDADPWVWAISFRVLTASGKRG